MKTIREEDRFIHESWCFENGILVYAEGIKGTKLCRIVVNFKGKIKLGEKQFKQGKQIKKNDEKWWEMIWKLRKHYYDKNH